MGAEEAWRGPEDRWAGEDGGADRRSSFVRRAYLAQNLGAEERRNEHSVKRRELSSADVPAKRRPLDQYPQSRMIRSTCRIVTCRSLAPLQEPPRAAEPETLSAQSPVSDPRGKRSRSTRSRTDTQCSSSAPLSAEQERTRRRELCSAFVVACLRFRVRLGNAANAFSAGQRAVSSSAADSRARAGRSLHSLPLFCVQPINLRIPCGWLGESRLGDRKMVICVVVVAPGSAL